MSYKDLVNMSLQKPEYNERIPNYVDQNLKADIASLKVYPKLNNPFLYESEPNHTSNLKANITSLSPFHESIGSQGSQGSPGPELPPRLPQLVRKQRLEALQQQHQRYNQQIPPTLPSKHNRKKNKNLKKPEIPPRKIILDDTGRPLNTPSPPSHSPPPHLLKHRFNDNFLKSLESKIAKQGNMNTLTPPYGVSKALFNSVPVANPYYDKYPLQDLSNLKGVTPYNPSHYGDGPLEFLVEKYGGKRKTRRKSKRKNKKSRRKPKNKRKTRRRKIKKNKKKSRRRKR